MKRRYSNVLNFGLAIISLMSGLVGSFSSHAQQKQDEGNAEITGFSQAQSSIVRQKIASSEDGGPCGQYIRKRGFKTGFNNVGTPSEFALAIGTGKVAQKLTDPLWVDGRYVAFREAWLKANGQLAKSLEQQVRVSAISRVRTGLNNNYTEPGALPATQAQNLRAQANKIQENKKYDKNIDSGIVEAASRGVRLINAELEVQLKKRGHDLEAERKALNDSNLVKKNQLAQRAAAAEEEAKKLLSERSFKELIDATARERMKGIYSWFTNENVTPSGDETNVCVVLRYSKKSERLADAMASRDFSKVEKTQPGKPLIAQLPDPSKESGIFDLIKSWGMTVLVDENGDVNLVAFGQSGYQVGDQNGEIAAKRDAQLKAEGLIRLFINNTVAVQQASNTAQNVRSYNDNLNRTVLTKAYVDKISQGAGFAPINGITPIISAWVGIHPITNAGVAGAVVAWNASAASGALSAKRRQNTSPQDSGGVSTGSREAPPAPKSVPATRRGGMSESTRSNDF